jgi:prepilin-type N-terminal cleavage/methylation domain-containing protein
MPLTNRSHGFSLIEVAVGLLIISIIITPMIVTYNLYIKERQITTSTGNIGLFKTALQRYVIRYGCYPLPATPGVTSANATFGQEAVVRASCVGIGAVPACAGNDTVMCQTATGTGGATVYIGDVPFATLGLPHDYILDGYGSKLTYAVTAALTVSATFADNGGAIIVHDNSGGNTANGVATTGNIHYIVVSHGKDRVGAFSPEGVLQGNCGAVAAAVDNQNCNNDAIFSDNYGLNGAVGAANTKYMRLGAEAPGATHYDDFVGWAVTTASDLWIKHPAAANILNNNTGNIRIGMAGALPPTAKADVRDVTGGTGVKADALWTNNLCNATGGCAAPGALVTTQYPPNVFTPAVIGGTPAAADAQLPGGGIDCTGAAMIGIANSNEICTGNIKVPPGLINTALCPAGQGGCQVHPGAVGSMGCRVPGGPCI